MCSNELYTILFVTALLELYMFYAVGLKPTIIYVFLFLFLEASTPRESKRENSKVIESHSTVNYITKYNWKARKGWSNGEREKFNLSLIISLSLKSRSSEQYKIISPGSFRCLHLKFWNSIMDRNSVVSCNGYIVGNVMILNMFLVQIVTYIATGCQTKAQFVSLIAKYGRGIQHKRSILFIYMERSKISSLLGGLWQVWSFTSIPWIFFILQNNVNRGMLN